MLAHLLQITSNLAKKSYLSTQKENDDMTVVPAYSSVVGSLMYAMVFTRPDITHAIGLVSRFLSNPGKDHLEAMK